MHICQAEKAGISLATADSVCVDNGMCLGRHSDLQNTEEKIAYYYWVPKGMHH